MTFLSLDLETTGLDESHDRIVEIAIVRDGASAFSARVNPGIPIPAAASAIHGIMDADVKGAPPFKDHAAHVRQLLEGQTVVTFGGNRFDVPLLCEEMLRAGVDFDHRSVTWIDAGELFKILAPRTLSAAVAEYLGRPHDGAHGAETDALATAQVFAEMMVRHPDQVGRSTPAELAIASRHGQPMADPRGLLAYDKDGVLCFNTKNNKGVPIRDEMGYAEWMLKKDFPLATKRMLEAELEAIEREAVSDVEAEAVPMVAPGQATIPF